MPLVPRVWPVLVAQRVQRERRVRLALQAPRVSPEPRVQQAIGVLPESLVLPVLRALPEPQARRVQRARRAPMELPVPRVRQGLLAPRAPPEPLVRQV